MRLEAARLVLCFLMMAMIAGCHRREYVCTITEECLDRVHPPCRDVFEDGYAPVVRPEYRWNAGAGVQVAIVELASGEVLEVVTEPDRRYKTCNYRFEPVGVGDYLVAFRRDGEVVDSSGFTVVACVR